MVIVKVDNMNGEAADKKRARITPLNPPKDIGVPSIAYLVAIVLVWLVTFAKDRGLSKQPR